MRITPYNSPSAGGGASAGLIYTFESTVIVSAPGAGKFRTNNADAFSTGALTFNNTPKGSSLSIHDFLLALPSGVQIVFTSLTNGDILVGTTNAPSTDETDYILVNPTFSGSGVHAWAGDYLIAFLSPYVTLATLLAAAGITPAPDGTIGPVNSITTQGGIPTAIS